MFGVALTDRDEARFFAMRTIPPNEWVTVEFSPSDFELSEASPVTKDRFEPERAGEAYVVLDIGSYLGFASGSNTLEVDTVTISRR